MTFHPALPHISCGIFTLPVFLVGLAFSFSLHRWVVPRRGLTSITYSADNKCPLWFLESKHLSCPNAKGSDTWEKGWAGWCSRCCSYCLWCWAICASLGLQPPLFAKRDLHSLWSHSKPLRPPKAAGFASQLLQERAGQGSRWGTALSHVRQDRGLHGPSVSKYQPQLEQTILISKRSIEPIKIISWTCSSDIIPLRAGRWSPRSVSCLQGEGFEFITFGMEMFSPTSLLQLAGAGVG